ncbi:polyprenyl transferase pyr6 [Colletotrichum spaethianum]|uniref:Diterpenoid pyrone biosynthesis cluster protein C n=1 Tax=Colletotrichum spaethianum TaxID=700344 RepID=A0AA37P6N5_9PEZI|nr:polyprenyl transferase pyr6 [Colletotrichum spaethianum]GKT46896.1 polyprenyl transferase pyr6 [Colletotrichum spaethianum]
MPLTSTDRQLVRQLLKLSRFDRYNPLFTTFAGVWSTLLAGGARIAEHRANTSAAFVFQQCALVFVAAYLFCGAGMVWNDWIDRDIDAHVARTKERPLASGKVTTTEAMWWMMLQVAMCWGVLDVMLDSKDVLKHMIPVALASILYPFGKRPLARKLRIYPQYILAFTIAWPAVIGRAAIYGQYESFAESVRHCLPLCTMVYFWTIYLNTAYSYQDVVDDRKLGVNSFYNIAGKHIHLLLIALVTPILVCLPIYLIELHSIWLWVSWMGVWTASLVLQLVQFDPKQPASGGSVHKSNFVLGIWTILACVVQVFLTSNM